MKAVNLEKCSLLIKMNANLTVVATTNVWKCDCFD